VVVLHVGGTKLSDIKLVFQRAPRTSKTWFPAGLITANEEHVVAAVRELHEEIGLILTPDDLTLLSDAYRFVSRYLSDNSSFTSTRLFFMCRTLRPICVLQLSSSRL
jgi:8-oxo-dGTP pyrophosphatase MutT (NUDIX family)